MMSEILTCPTHQWIYQCPICQVQTTPNYVFLWEGGGYQTCSYCCIFLAWLLAGNFGRGQLFESLLLSLRLVVIQALRVKQSSPAF